MKYLVLVLLSMNVALAKDCWVGDQFKLKVEKTVKGYKIKGTQVINPNKTNKIDREISINSWNLMVSKDNMEPVKCSE